MRKMNLISEKDQSPQKETHKENRLKTPVCFFLAALFIIISVYLRAMSSDYFYNLNIEPLLFHRIFYLEPFENQTFYRHVVIMIQRLISGNLLGTLFILLPGVYFLWEGFQDILLIRHNFFNKALILVKNEKMLKNCIFWGIFLLCAAIHFFIMLGHAYYPEEFAHQFQGELFLQGKVSIESPDMSYYFTPPFIAGGSCRQSTLPAGMPVLFVIFQFFGISFFLSPLFCAGSGLLIYNICNKIFNKSSAVMAVLLFAASPCLIIWGASALHYSAMGFFLLLIFHSLIMDNENLTCKALLILSAAVFFAGLINPNEALFSVPVITVFALYCRFINTKTNNNKAKQHISKKENYSIQDKENKTSFLSLVKKADSKENNLAAITIVVFSFLLSSVYLNSRAVANEGILSPIAELSNAFSVFLQYPTAPLWNFTALLFRLSFWTAPFVFLGILSAYYKKPLYTLAGLLPSIFLCIYYLISNPASSEKSPEFLSLAYLLVVPISAWGLQILIKQVSIIKKTSLYAVYASVAVSIFIYSGAGIYPRLLTIIHQTYNNEKAFYKIINNTSDYQIKTLLFVKDYPGSNAFRYLRNKPNYEDEKLLLSAYLMPETNIELIKTYPHRDPLILTFNQEENAYVIHPYPEMEDPSSLDYLAAAENYIYLQDYIKAETAFMRALEYSQDNPKIRKILAKFYFNTKQFRKSAELLKRLTREEPDMPETNYLLGIILGELELYNEGIFFLERYLELNPESNLRSNIESWIKLYKEKAPDQKRIYDPYNLVPAYE